MSERHHVYLVPGFFGFANLGALRYFSHVRELLRETLAARGLDAAIHDVPTRPTASILVRAQRLADVITETSAGDQGPIHIIGHSTGGLDARLLASPGIDLGDAASADHVEAVATRIRSITTIATPHYGTPLASSFVGFAGERILRLLSLATVDLIRNRRISLLAVQSMLRLLNRLDEAAGAAAGIFDQISDQLLQDFDPDRRDAVSAFFSDVGNDRSLIQQLSPEGTELLRAALRSRPGVLEASVLTRARRPRLFDRAELGLDTGAQVLHGIFSWLYQHAGYPPGRDLPRGAADADRLALIASAFGDAPEHADNDGIVPTMSQAWGRVIHATRADHLDVVGHFRDPAHDPPHVDWLPSGSGFTRPAFEALWGDVADFVVSAR